MTLNYTLEEDDFIYALRFNIANSKPAQGIRKIVKYGLVLFFIGFAIQFRDTYPIAIFYLTVSVLSFFFFDKLYDGKIKSLCKRSLKQTHSDSIGKPVTLTFNHNNLWIKDIKGEQYLDYAEILHIMEVKPYFIIRQSNGLSMPIPKRYTDPEEVRTFLETIDIPFIQNLDYK